MEEVCSIFKNNFSLHIGFFFFLAYPSFPGNISFIYLFFNPVLFGSGGGYFGQFFW